jgi:acetolactate synthase-1/2/3 large subunit
MILFVGQIARFMREREAFQEVDFRRMFGEVAKWVAEIDSADRIPEFVSHAFHVATSGRPGPVVLALPEDMLRERVAAPAIRPMVPVETHPGPGEMAEFARLLNAAERPLVIAGGSRWDEAAVAHLRGFAERFDLPVACSFRRQSLFDHEHPNYAGDVGVAIAPKLLARVNASDFLVLLGGRMSEMPSQGYSLLAIPEPGQNLVHVHPGAEELGRVYHPTLAIHATPSAFVAATERLQAPAAPRWAGQAATAHADFLAWTEPKPIPGPLQMGEIMGWLRTRLPEDAILTNGAGNYTGWVHRFHRFRRWNTQLGPTSGSMGYGLPAAVAAKLRFPDRVVLAFAGDGCFQMTGQEFGTAIQEKAAVIVILVNNGIYGTIRMHQERDYPGRVSATDLVNPDFAALARAYGGHGELVERTEEFAPAFERALASGKPAILELRLDPEIVTTSATLTAIRGKSRR